MMMDKGRTTTTTISDLPEEVLTHILVRLSAKDIVASCVSVQKSWDSLIKTNMFKTLHSNYQKNIIINPPNKKYLLFWDLYKTECYKIRLDDIQCEEHHTLKYPPDLEDCFLFRLVSNGLICLFNSTMDHKPIHLWNPVIQKYKTLPPSPHPPCSSYTWIWCRGIAFGFVSQINDYLVVYVAKYGLKNKPHTHYIITCVYSLSTNSWKTITHDDHDSIPDIVFISQYNSVFVNGVAIWAGGNSRGERVLVCFDTKTEMLRQILLPHWLEGCRLNSAVIHAFDHSVAYFVEDDKHGFGNQLGAWVLKGDPMNEFSWEKKMMVALHRDVTASVMGVRNNGEPILCNEYDLISYNLDTHKSYDFVKSWDSWAPSFCPEYWDDDCGTPFEITPFEESLGLLDVDCTQY